MDESNGAVWPVNLICMLCGEVKDDAPAGAEMDEYGDLWSYCRDCDCWTAHPTPESTFGSVGKPDLQ